MTLQKKQPKAVMRFLDLESKLMSAKHNQNWKLTINKARFMVSWHAFKDLIA